MMTAAVMLLGGLVLADALLWQGKRPPLVNAAIVILLFVVALPLLLNKRARSRFSYRRQDGWD